jgi:hypothetical protein
MVCEANANGRNRCREREIANMIREGEESIRNSKRMLDDEGDLIEGSEAAEEGPTSESWDWLDAYPRVPFVPLRMTEV